MKNSDFEQEQAHLRATHAQLRDIEAALVEQVTGILDQARTDKSNMLDELAVDFTGEVDLETFVEMQAVQETIDRYNLSADIGLERLGNVRRLLEQPYFAKISLVFKKGEAPRDLYIGTVGMTDDERRHFIIDWRSPVAEVYYNQENGATSYEADGRTINVDLKLRRQFDIEGDVLKACFDTTVAIQDPLLLASLAQSRSSHLQAITTTIQREQNQVIRHPDVNALLVAGVAGSGKTSVLLQRIAYLFYRERENLDPRDVCLVSPNSVFVRYIEDVLPDMGEANPQTITWSSLMDELGLGDRGLGSDSSAETLRAIDEQVDALEFEDRDFADIFVDEERVVSAAQVRTAVRKFLRNAKPGVRLAALVEDELVEKVQARAKSRAANEEVQGLIYDLDADEQFRLYGQQVVVQDEDELQALAYTYLRDRYRGAIEQIRDGRWLRIDRIGMRMLSKEHLTSAEYLYLKMALTGVCSRHTRYVMVDEVQDYTQPQLMVLGRYFPNAHFLLLGDANQAIEEGTASWNEIRAVFEHRFGQVSECRLTTSYRSTPQITALFGRLMDASDGWEAQSVQREGEEPRVVECADAEAYAEALAEAVRDARAALGGTAGAGEAGVAGAAGAADAGEAGADAESAGAAGTAGATGADAAGAAGADEAEGGLCAIVVPDGYRRKKLTALLEERLGSEAPVVMDGTQPLPDAGVVLLSLKNAKGLEFDRVIVAEAQQGGYGEGDVARRRLYTACSRATRSLTIVANGPLDVLLAR